MAALSGGTEFPAPQPRRRKKGNQRRGAAIMKAIQAHMTSGISGGTPAGQPVKQRRVEGMGIAPKPNQAPRIQQGGQVGLGPQLTRRVQSGAIDQSQAKKVAGERRLLENTYGENWRNDVYGGAGKVQQARLDLKADPDNQSAQDQYNELLAKRKKMIEQARRKQIAKGTKKQDINLLGE